MILREREPGTRTTNERRRRGPLARYAHWLHLRWPAGGVEPLPDAREDFSTNVPGLYIVGDLTGVPLLKLSADAGARVVRTIATRHAPFGGPEPDAPNAPLDLAIVGAGVAGFAAALEARKLGLRFRLFEASEPFSTIVNFPKAKPIYTYPSGMEPAGDLRFHEKAKVKEGLLDDLREQTVAQGIVPVIARVSHVRRGSGGPLELVFEDEATHQITLARAVVVAIGRTGNYRKLGVPGEDLPKVYNRLHDPKDYAGQRALVVGGGDTAVETAIALTRGGAQVTLSYRGATFNRAKPENVEQLEALHSADAQRTSGAAEVEAPSDVRASTAVGEWTHASERGSLQLLLSSHVTAIRDDAVELRDATGDPLHLPNDVVFTMIGREPPLDFFRRSGVRIRGEHNAAWWLTLSAFLLVCVWTYHWKRPGVTITGIGPIDRALDIGAWWQALGWFPYGVSGWLAALGEAWSRPSNLLGVLARALDQPGFYYSFAYCACVVGFGIDRIRRRRTPYVKWQTITLMAIQVVPLFLLPYLVLPWMGHNGWFADGAALAPVADALFERHDDLGHDRAYWRSFGFILAWPLFIWNVFTEQPMCAWLAISFLQTFVIIPLIVYRWGKGAYCGWICSCGALAETLGDRHRWKMPHGPWWNRLNLLGQAFLAFALLLLGLRVLGWLGVPFATSVFYGGLNKLPLLNYAWFVDLVWAGIFGVGLYFWFSGRVWCRFACPLAALMHVYHRFSRFRILADKKKCISCNVCTSVCHQGIDVMSFANKGEPMADPQCVRCSACVQMCPTGVLSFGRVDRHERETARDPAWLIASPVQMVELRINGHGIDAARAVRSYETPARTPASRR